MHYESIETNRFTIITQGNISKIVINTYMNCDNVPLLWRKFSLNMANNRDYVFIFCNRPFKNFDWHCRECYFFNNPDANDIKTLTDEKNNYGGYWQLFSQKSSRR